MPSKHLFRVGLAATAAAMLVAGCSQDVPPHLKPLTADAMHLMGERGMSARDPIFVRIFKAESELEVWKQRADGHFYHFKTYPICNWSGDLGPKLQQGDHQSPEGFYTVAPYQMNPNSDFHLSFNLGFPNKFDAANKRTGQFLMVHGNCKSAGCYAMTDGLVEEIYALARESFAGGQKSFEVHAFPFRMTPENLALHRKNKWMPFWMQLKDGYEYFETTRQVPPVQVCSKRYLVGAEFVANAGRVKAEGPCPIYRRAQVVPFTPLPDQIASPVVMPGKKVRSYAELMPTPGNRPGGAYGLTSDKPTARVEQSFWSRFKLGDGGKGTPRKALINR